MYGSYTRNIMEMAQQAIERKRDQRLKAEHAHHAASVGIQCDETHLVGASWVIHWQCRQCGWVRP